LLGEGGLLNKYLSGENESFLAPLLDPKNANANWAFKDVKAFLSGLSTQIGLALTQNASDPKLNPLLEAYQSMLDSGAIEGLIQQSLRAQ
jgi:hypothetical protein